MNPKIFGWILNSWSGSYLFAAALDCGDVGFGINGAVQVSLWAPEPQTSKYVFMVCFLPDLGVQGRVNVHRLHTA